MPHCLVYTFGRANLYIQHIVFLAIPYPDSGVLSPGTLNVTSVLSYKNPFSRLCHHYNAKHPSLLCCCCPSPESDLIINGATFTQPDDHCQPSKPSNNPSFNVEEEIASLVGSFSLWRKAEQAFLVLPFSFGLKNSI